MLLLAAMIVATVASTHLRADMGTCGGSSFTLPFTDVPAANVFFCSIAEAYFAGLTNGTTGTTYSPSANVPREQMAAFVTRTMDQSLKRGSRRASLNQWWTPSSRNDLALTDVGVAPGGVVCDGADVWIANGDASISRVRASDGKLLDTWTGASGGRNLVAAKGRIFVAGGGGALGGRLYRIDPRDPAGAVTMLSDMLGDSPYGVTFDGARVWTANIGGSVSIVELSPVSVTTVTAGFSYLAGILYDGSNIWVTDDMDNTLMKLDSNGAILQTFPTSFGPGQPAFDGTNIWVPNYFGTVTVVRVKDSNGNALATPFILATLSGNGLDGAEVAAFDGERILITNLIGNSVSLWKAADLIPLGSVGTGANSNPLGACSDGLNFWISLQQSGKLVRF
jgi:hypothetical protein